MRVKPPSQDYYRGTWHDQFPALAGVLSAGLRKSRYQKAGSG
jgi:hypothetical protein